MNFADGLWVSSVLETLQRAWTYAVLWLVKSRVLRKCGGLVWSRFWNKAILLGIVLLYVFKESEFIMIQWYCTRNKLIKNKNVTCYFWELGSWQNIRWMNCHTYLALLAFDWFYWHDYLLPFGVHLLSSCWHGRVQCYLATSQCDQPSQDYDLPWFRMDIGFNCMNSKLYQYDMSL